MPPARRTDHALAFAAGGVLSLMVLFNGQFAQAGTALFASWAAHGTGMVAACLLLLALPALRGTAPASPARVPLWAYLGGVSGAVTVMATSTTVNSPLLLSGTLALGILGQISFGLVSDALGLFGMARRLPVRADLAALCLILAGSALIIFAPDIAPGTGAAVAP